VTPIEGRTRAAMDAITGLVEGVPTLTLPPPPGAASRSRRRRGAPWPRPHWGSWLAPVAAAAAVLAIAFTLVAVRDLPGARTPAHGIGAAGAPVSIPTYYLTFDQPRGDATVPVGLVLGATLTGKKLATLPPPSGLSFAGVTGAANDRTFVADAHRDPYGVQGSWGRSRTWYLVRVVGTGSRVSLAMKKLPIKPTPVGTLIDSMTLSPDGTMLAVVSQPDSDKPDEQEWVRVYSVATGAVLHAWSSPADQIPPIEGGGGQGGDDNATLAWVGDSTLAFFGGVQTGLRTSALAIRVLDLSRPDGGIEASSRAAVQVPFSDYGARPPFGCDLIFRSDIVITGNGKSFVCGGSGASSATLPKLYCLKQPTWNIVAFAGFSLTGQKPPGRILSGYRTGCSGYNVTGYAVWANATGSAIIGYMLFGDKTSGRFGVFSDGSFRPLPIPVPGNSYQYFAGSLLYQVAW
jgi:hypothetical protein